jgi:hypothetical protein
MWPFLLEWISGKSIFVSAAYQAQFHKDIYGRDGCRKRRVCPFKAKIYQDKLGQDGRRNFLSFKNYAKIRRPGL